MKETTMTGPIDMFPASEAVIEHVPDVNLTAWVSEQLKALGHSKPTAWERRLSVTPVTVEGGDLIPLHQMFRINNALRYLLVDSPRDTEGNKLNTFETRCNIIDDIAVDSWQKLLLEKVLPYIVEYDIK